MDDESTHILRRLNDTWKILFLDADVAMLAGMTALLGFVLDHIIPGLVAAGAVGYAGHKFKGDRHPAYLFHLLYWYFPPVFPQTKLSRTPPSHFREMVG